MKSSWTGICLLLTTLGGVATASAACGDPEDAKPFKRDFVRRMRCEIHRASGVPVSCSAPEAVCGAAIDSYASVLDGVSSERGCFREFYRQSRRYLSRRSRELRRDQRPAARAASFVSKISDRCAGETLTPGGTCSGLTDPVGVAFCARATLEALAQKGSGAHVRPNIVLVLTDDQRWDSLWAMPLLQDLVLDRGLEFVNSFKSTSLCCPDRASIFTGLYAHNHGVTSNEGAHAFDHDGDTIQKQLQQNAGYRTALLGKYMVNTGAALGAAAAPGWNQWHVFLQQGGFGRTHGLYYNYRLSTNGFERLYSPLDEFGEPTNRHEYSTDLLAQRSVGLIDAWHERPFFIEYAPFAPHTRPVPADRHDGLFAGIPLHRPPNHMPPNLAGKPDWVKVQYYFAVWLGGQPAATDLRREKMMETLPAVDEAIRDISDALELHGLTDNTLLAFTSDNGFMYLEHWLSLKNYPYEESIRVPLAIRYPLRIPAPRQVPELVQSIDFYPTFAELGGIPGAAVNGRSLVPLFDGNSAGWRDEILIEHYAPAAAVDTSSGIRTHDWKLIRTEASAGVTLELYDMQNDPFEMTNVADVPANAGLIATLGAKLDLLELE